MKRIAKLFHEMECAISAELDRGRQTIRGAAIVELGDCPDRPLLAVYGRRLDQQVSGGGDDFQRELEVVRAGLPGMGLREVLTYVCKESCYLVIVAPEEPLEIDVDEE